MPKRINDMNIKALSIKQPWAHCIMYLGKDIENRTRKTNIRGKIVVHASKQIDYDAYYKLKFLGYSLPSIETLAVGKLIGTIDLIDCVAEHSSQWKEEGTFGYVLKNPIPFNEPIPAKGQLGFWECEIPSNLKY